MARHLDDPSLGTLFSRLTTDGKSYVQAEIRFYKALAAERGARLGMAIGFGVAALLLVSSAITAMLVGLVMTLATLVGPGWATLIVVVATLLIAGILGLMAKSRLSRALAPVPGSK